MHVAERNMKNCVGEIGKLACAVAKRKEVSSDEGGQ